MRPFLAIDFETADYKADSACALGLVRVEAGEIVRKDLFMIRPPRGPSSGLNFVFSYIHGITWKDVESAKNFGELWPEMRSYFEGVDFVAAHNAHFDRKVLKSCCEAYGLSYPESHYLCTVQLARKTWNIFPTKLPNVCSHLGIGLNHHEALSDAEACARIVIAAQRAGFDGPS